MEGMAALFQSGDVPVEPAEQELVERWPQGILQCLEWETAEAGLRGLPGAQGGAPTEHARRAYTRARDALYCCKRRTPQQGLVHWLGDEMAACVQQYAGLSSSERLRRFGGSPQDLVVLESVMLAQPLPQASAASKPSSLAHSPSNTADKEQFVVSGAMTALEVKQYLRRWRCRLQAACGSGPTADGVPSDGVRRQPNSVQARL